MPLRVFWLLPLIAAAASAQNPFTLSEADEIALGRAAAVEVEKEVKVIEDPGITAYIQKLGDALVQKSTRANIAYTFRVVNSPEVNAFALPGGFIYVNRGLIEAAGNEDELAGVLGHEIGHVVARHGAEQAARAGLVQTGIAALGGLLGGRSGTAGTITKQAAQMVAAGVFMKFSRDAERQADNLGARMLMDSNRSPQAMVSFFEKLANLQKTQPNAVQRFFSSHPSPVERASNISTLAPEAASTPEKSSREFAEVRQKLQALPRPELEAQKAAAAREASAVPLALAAADIRARNVSKDREIAERYAPVVHQALGPAPRFDFITNFDFDGDWRGDNNWVNADNPSMPLKAHVYYSLSETRTHYFIHYAFFHPRDYKGGEKRGALLSEAIRLGVQLGGQYDPTGRANEAVLSHENDLEGALVVVDKKAQRVAVVETLAHNVYLKYVPTGSEGLAAEVVRMDGNHPQLYAEPMGHGVENWREDVGQTQRAVHGFLQYRFTGRAEDPDTTRKDTIGYDLVPLLDTLWPRARGAANETFGLDHDYGLITAHFDNRGQDVERTVKMGVLGSALNGKVGAANMSRPPWGWFEGEERGRPLGEWFLNPAETVKRHWNFPDSFSTTYVYNPYLGQYRE